MCSNVLKGKLTNVKAQVFNIMKDSTGNSKRIYGNQKQFEILDNDHSDIIEPSDNEDHEGEDGDDDHLVQNILSRFRNEDRSSIDYEEQPESEISHEDHVEGESEVIERHKPVEFHQKVQLLIDTDPESEEDEEEVVVINSKGGSRNDHEMLNNDQEEDGESNYSPWLEKGQNKMSPFQNFRKRLIINTDSIDSGNLKSLKTNGKYTI
jgi:hypothetical protein